MSQASPQKKSFPPGSSPEEKDERSLSRFARQSRERKNADGDGVHAAPDSTTEIPFGAIHVDASGIVLEHRPSEALESVPAASIAGRQFLAIAPWAAGPAFLSALKSAIDCTKASFHFDFKRPADSVERAVHMNILAAGDQTAWIFISDKTLPLLS